MTCFGDRGGKNKTKTPAGERWVYHLGSPSGQDAGHACAASGQMGPGVRGRASRSLKGLQWGRWEERVVKRTPSAGTEVGLLGHQKLKNNKGEAYCYKMGYMNLVRASGSFPKLREKTYGAGT